MATDIRNEIAYQTSQLELNFYKELTQHMKMCSETTNDIYKGKARRKIIDRANISEPKVQEEYKSMLGVLTDLIDIDTSKARKMLINCADYYDSLCYVVNQYHKDTGPYRPKGPDEALWKESQKSVFQMYKNNRLKIKEHFIETNGYLLNDIPTALVECTSRRTGGKTMVLLPVKEALTFKGNKHVTMGYGRQRIEDPDTKRRRDMVIRKMGEMLMGGK